ncbi:MAG TPA: TonB-dependent receptor plug domain-containing protein, partial [Bacteroidales bacterium]|nr:TonB-dependent receptor plug domain-containing protein [Bacteroidales bacterium]
TDLMGRQLRADPSPGRADSPGSRATARITFSLLAIVFSLLAVTPGYGQKTLIKVLDQKSREPVAFAHICFEGLISGAPRYCLTSLEGTAVNDVREISKVAISYMGYVTHTDTIRPGQSLEVVLRPKVLNMDEVVITAQYTPEKADKSIYKVGVLNARTIEQRAATNMAELLRDQTSMQVTQQGVLGTSLRINGLSGENVKFLQDGVPLIGRMNGNFDLNQINLFNVDHIEVIEGPMSVIYGSNALAGVINIISRENRSSLLNVSAGGYAESVGVFNVDAAASFNRKQHGFGIDGGRNFFAGYSPVDTSRAKTYKPRRQYYLDGYYTYTTKAMKIKLAGEYFNELLLDQGPLMQPYFETAFDNHFTTSRYTVHGEGAFNLPKSHFINVLASWSVFNRIRETWFKDLTTLESNPVLESWAQDTNRITNFTARGTFAQNHPGHRFNYQAGFDVNVESGTGSKILDNRQETGDYAAFVSLRWDPVRVGGPRQGGGTPTGLEDPDRVVLSIQPGLRLIHNTRYRAPLVYALSTRWNISPPLNLRFSYSRGFRRHPSKNFSWCLLMPTTMSREMLI